MHTEIFRLGWSIDGNTQRLCSKQAIKGFCTPQVFLPDDYGSGLRSA
jgi:hypothetical protein